mmetsp:Transcript_46731/g.117755  ORF Transcript_46731/g.117755 Transcript_46731/m.117755 type:complete len:268 (-) Transcript_46731:1070-1873(-)
MRIGRWGVQWREIRKKTTLNCLPPLLFGDAAASFHNAAACHVCRLLAQGKGGGWGLTPPSKWRRCLRLGRGCPKSERRTGRGHHTKLRCGLPKWRWSSAERGWGSAERGWGAKRGGCWRTRPKRSSTAAATTAKGPSGGTTKGRGRRIGRAAKRGGGWRRAERAGIGWCSTKGKGRRRGWRRLRRRRRLPKGECGLAFLGGRAGPKHERRAGWGSRRGWRAAENEGGGRGGSGSRRGRGRRALSKHERGGGGRGGCRRLLPKHERSS